MAYIQSLPTSEEALAALLPNISSPIEKSSSIDVASTSLLLFTHLSTRTSLTPEATFTILRVIGMSKASLELKAMVMSLIVILSNQTLPQEELPDELVERMLKEQDGWQGSAQYLCQDSLLVPLAKTLSGKLCKGEGEDEAKALLEVIIRSSYLTSHGAQTIALSLIKPYFSPISITSRLSLLALLKNLYLLHSESLVSALNSLKQEDDTNQEGELERLLVRITFPQEGDAVMEGVEKNDNARMGAILTSSAEAPLRAKGVTILLSHNGEEQENAEALLLARMSDSDPEVLSALYAQPEKLSAIIGYEVVMKKLESLFTQGGEMSTDILGAHAAFLLAVAKKEDKSKGIIGRILWPYLMITKSGYKRSTSTWRALQSSPAGVDSDALLKKCLVIVGDIDWKEAKGDTSKLGDLNHQLAEHIASNIVTSTHYEEVVDFLLEQAATLGTGTGKLLALVVLFILLTTHKKYDLASRLTSLLQTVDFAVVEGKPLELNKIEWNRLHSKPEHRSTYARVYSALVLALPSAIQLEGDVDWFIPSKSGASTKDLYTLLNSLPHPTICTQALRSLFLSVGEGSLLLLASIWTSSKHATIQISALKHGEAFIRALITPEAGITRDFQLVLPLLLVALMDSDAGVRRAAGSCLRLIGNPGGVEVKKSPEMYGIDLVSEKQKGEIKFLDWSDFVKYTQALAATVDSIELDGTALVSAQQEILETKGRESKEARWRKRVLSYLLSHIVGWPTIGTRTSLLVGLSRMEDGQKVFVLAPLFQELTVEWMDQDGGKMQMSERKELPTGVWQGLLEVTRRYSEGREEFEAVIPTIKGVLNLLNLQQRLELCRMLLGLIGNTTQSPLLQLLSSTVEDEETLVTLISELRPISSSEQPAKRARLETDASPLFRLTIMCQAVSMSNAKRTTAALRVFLGALDATLDARGVEQTELSHIQQGIMSAMMHVTGLVESGESDLRIDVLVKLIKDSNNPQIIHQALLLVAALAQWSSESLLHHLTPILFSTGSYISPRDDVYSMRVAEKTVDSIIPLLVSHLRSKHPKRADLQIAARPYLLIFTDTATVISLHRRAAFFLHLVSVLGVADFLTPICLLLLDVTQLSDASLKSQSERLNLAVQIVYDQVPEIRLAALSELLEDVATEMVSTPSTDASLVSHLRAGSVESSDNRYRIGRILTLVNLILERSRPNANADKDEYSQRILGALVRLLAAVDSLPSDNTTQSLRETLQASLHSASRLVSPFTVLHTCLQLSRSNDATLQLTLYELLSARLKQVSPDARGKMADNMILMIRIIRETLVISDVPRLSASALDLLQAINTTSQSVELPALTQAIPNVIANLQDQSTSAKAVETLYSFCGTLGPRIVPYLSSIVQATTSVLNKEKGSHELLSSSINLLRRLLDTASSFWSVADATLLIRTCISNRSKNQVHGQDSLKSLSKHAAKRLSTQIFINAFTNTWKSIEHANFKQGWIDGAFVILRQGIKNADRSQIAQEARSLLTIFLDAWDTYPGIESDSPSIKAFIELIIKLNDISFKPLYRIMFDWAWNIGQESKSLPKDGRAIAYCQVMGAALLLLKGLITPYMAPFIGRVAEILDVWSKDLAAFSSPDLWEGIVSVIKQSIEVDDNTFWRDEFVRIIGPALVRQIPLVANSREPRMTELLGDTLAILGTLSDSYLKALNMDLLMQTRSEEAKSRLCALQCISRAWSVNGAQLAGLKRETIPFLHECAEDENEDVIREARALKVVLDKF